MTDFDINTNPRSSGRLHNEEGAVDVEFYVDTSHKPTLRLKTAKPSEIIIVGEHNLATLGAAISKYLGALNRPGLA